MKSVNYLCGVKTLPSPSNESVSYRNSSFHFCFIYIYSGLSGDDPDIKLAKEMFENMYDLGVGFYVMIIGFIIIDIGIFLSHRDNWDKTTRTMEYIVGGIMAVITIVVIWQNPDTTDSVNLENAVVYPESYCCEISSNYDMNENL